MATWPATLPQQPLMKGAQEQFQSTTITTEMDVGPAKKRRRFTAAVEPWKGLNMLLTATQVTTFKTFYETTLLGGSLTFTFPNPRTGSSETFRFSGDAPTLSQASGDLYLTSFELEKMP